MEYKSLKGLISSYQVHKLEKDRKKANYRLSIYFGVPGTGKTTMAAYIARKSLKNDIPVYSNVPMKGCYILNKDDLGKYMLQNCTIIIDEAGVDFNNRNYKALKQELIFFLKYHRHYKCNIHVFSQSHEDMDITFRRLAFRYYVLKKSLIPKMVVCRRIVRKVGIDEMTNQIADKYAFVPWWLFGVKRIWCPPLWKMFDSYNIKELPSKEWEIWDTSEKTIK